MRSANAACAAFAVSYMHSRTIHLPRPCHAQELFGEFSKCTKSLKTLLTVGSASIPDLYLDARAREFDVRNISRNSRRNTSNAICILMYIEISSRRM